MYFYVPPEVRNNNSALNTCTELNDLLSKVLKNYVTYMHFDK